MNQDRPASHDACGKAGALGSEKFIASWLPLAFFAVLLVGCSTHRAGTSGGAVRDHGRVRDSYSTRSNRVPSPNICGSNQRSQFCWKGGEDLPAVPPRWTHTVIAQFSDSNAVETVEFGEHGQSLYVGGLGVSITRWTFGETESIRRFEHPRGVVLDLVFDSGRNRLIAGSWDGTATTWSVRSETITRRYNHGAVVHGVDVRAEGSYLATAGGTKTILWSQKRRARVGQFSHEGTVGVVKFGPRGKYLVSGVMNGNVTVRRLSSRSRTRQIRYNGGVADLAWSPSGRRLVIPRRNGRLTVWRIPGWKAITHRKLGTSIRSVAYSPAGRRFVTGDASGRIILWSREGDRRIRSTRIGESVTAVSFGPGGHTLAAATAAGTVSVRGVAPVERGYSLVKRMAGDTKTAPSGTDSNASRSPTIRKAFLQVFGAPVVEEVRFDRDNNRYLLRIEPGRKWAGSFSSTLGLSSEVLGGDVPTNQVIKTLLRATPEVGVRHGPDGIKIVGARVSLFGDTRFLRTAGDTRGEIAHNNKYSSKPDPNTNQ